MACIREIHAILCFILILNNYATADDTAIKAETTTSKTDEEELVQSETKDGKLEIIKRIKKVNPDGSYTIGYEADDGSFKIESRDVLGNIKGTYGFVDEEGELKRVSYSSSNASEVFTKHEPLNAPEFSSPSVVQRIPKHDGKSYTTKNISIYSTEPSTTSATTPNSVIQSIARRRASSTTGKPTLKHDSVTYASAGPRVLLQRPSLVSTVTTKFLSSESKSEGQINRPDVTQEPTVLPLFKNLSSKRLEDTKPVQEETSETIRNNILRRQSPYSSSEPPLSPQDHVYSLQQSLGHNDVPDIYNNGVTVTSRPLFTTTKSNRLVPVISSTTASPVVVPKPTIKYAANYQKNNLLQVEANHRASYSQTVPNVGTSTEPASTSTVEPIVQIPPNRATEPLVAVRHPFQPGAILVPLSQLQSRRVIPIENMEEVYDARREYIAQAQLSTQTPAVDAERQRTKKINSPALRPLPVHVDENGFIREMPQHIPKPYPLPVPITPIPMQVRVISVVPAPVKQLDNNDIDKDIENIHPPVSTKDFQILLNYLIMRQKRLERVSELTNPRLHPEFHQPHHIQYQRVASTTTQPYFAQRVVAERPVSYELHKQEAQKSAHRPYVVTPQKTEVSQRYVYRYHQEDGEVEEPRRLAATYLRQPVYMTNRRAARLLPTRSPRQNRINTEDPDEESQAQNEEYLPPDVREMLLLRMLQLAMNPALPLHDEDESEQVATVSTPQYRKAPVRNLEILGEEEEDREPEILKHIPVSRNKRYKEEDMEYME